MKDKSIEKVETGGEVEPTRNERIYMPKTDIYEKDDAIIVRCDMPGVGRDQIDIRLDNTELEISGTQMDSRQEGVDLLTGEYEAGVFRRKFNVPQLIDRDKIRARLHNGVLDIELPKAEQTKPRKIEITAGG